MKITPELQAVVDSLISKAKQIENDASDGYHYLTLVVIEQGHRVSINFHLVGRHTSSAYFQCELGITSDLPFDLQNDALFSAQFISSGTTALEALEAISTQGKNYLEEERTENAS